MSAPIVIGGAVEAVLAVCTLLFLVRPAFLFKTKTETMGASYTWIGVILFCLLFTWSVVFGVILRLSEYSS